MSADERNPTPLELLLSDVAGAVQRAAQRVGAWLDQHREELQPILYGIWVMGVLWPELRRLQERYEGTEWELLLNRLDLMRGLGLLLVLDHGDEEKVDDLLEPALTHPEFLDELRAQVASSELPQAQRRQLVHALQLVSGHDYEIALPLLIVPLEGALVHEAERRKLVERAEHRMRFTPAAGRRGRVRSIEQIFEPLGLEEDVVTFLRRQVYGATGNPYRHGTAQGGWRSRSLRLVIALVIWLDLSADTQRAPLLARAFSRIEPQDELILSRLSPAALATAPERGSRAA